ncbi:MAG TPA: ComEA family DNA-binding protein [Polyangiales bacterium]|nr:ComEA family DNA-binding protein [Polyangiales bacterium]
MIRSSLLTCALSLACAGHGFAEERATVTETHGTSTATEARAPVVNINSASAEELERLPGIGPTRSRAILALRARVQSFHKIEDLLRVKGIGRATFRKLRSFLVLSGPTTLAVKAVRVAR